ncbi:MAG: UvrB/UvrC motif-containing protein [Candidatus Eremiobacteraeota bacterium]|nr:UvrB/UvrC motif-containing protein [Candidatus Eremiobacteraeota bacterium]
MFNPGLPDDQFFHLLIPHVPLTPAVRACPGCGLTFETFRNSSMVGCARCYDHFRDSLSLVVRRMQGSSNHSGKVPAKATDHLREEIARLRAMMKVAVESERFEEAANLRDQIHVLRRDLGDSSA